MSLAAPVSLVPGRGSGPPCIMPCSPPALRTAPRLVASPGQTHPGDDYCLKRGASCVVSPRTVYTVVTGVVRNMIPEGGWCVFYSTEGTQHTAHSTQHPELSRTPFMDRYWLQKPKMKKKCLIIKIQLETNLNFLISK
jgi:hypothetical protein